MPLVALPSYPIDIAWCREVGQPIFSSLGLALNRSDPPEERGMMWDGGNEGVYVVEESVCVRDCVYPQVMLSGLLHPAEGVCQGLPLILEEIGAR